MGHYRVGNISHLPTHYSHMKYGGAQLAVHLCLLFNSMLTHSFVPEDFCFGVIIPLLKHKHGDASKLDMYRGITLSSAVSKLFESVLVKIFGDDLKTDYSLVSRNIVAAVTLYSLSMKLLNISRNLVTGYIVLRWTPLRLLIKFYTMACFINC